MKFLSFLFSFYSKHDFRNRNRSKELCGNVGLTEYCFLPCEVDRQPTDHYFVKDILSITCYIYQHGYPPEPNLTPRRLLTIKNGATVCRGCNTDPNLLIDMFQQNWVCNSLKLGDDTLKTLAQDPNIQPPFPADLSNENPPFCCLPWCDDIANFQDFETTFNDFAPCFIAYQGSVIEQIVSKLTSLIEPTLENDREACRFSGMNNELNKCVSSISRLCRSNR